MLRFDVTNKFAKSSWCS